jgi:CRP/FNR family cyclic AMP-dependent transcriptional regulator
MKDVRVLQNVSLFTRLHQKHLQAIWKVCSERSFEPGDILMEQGNPGVGLFIIQDGRVKITKTLKDGSTIDMSENGPGDVIGEMSVLDGSTRTANVIAVTKTRCLVLAAWSFKALIEARPEVALGVLPIVVKRFRETTDRLSELSGSPAQLRPSDA